MPDLRIRTTLMEKILALLRENDSTEALARGNAAGECITAKDVQEWLTQFDRCQALREDNSYNEMCACGMGICAALYKKTPPLKYEVSESGESPELHQRIFTKQDPVSQMDWEELQNVVTRLQIEFRHLFDGGVEDVYTCKINLPKLAFCVMQRSGELLCNKFKHDTLTDVIDQCVNKDANGWCVVQEQAVRALLLGIHCLLSAHQLLVRAQYIPADNSAVPEDQIIRNYHREASLDDFYELEMMTKVPIGSIVQYRDKFRYLFHSVSQVVYYHYPSFKRGKQASLVELEATAVAAPNLLPLLLQVDPSTPMLYEHTGAGLAETHATHKYHWTVLGPFVLLVDECMQGYCAKDLRSLLRFKIEKVQNSQVANA